MRLRQVFVRAVLGMACCLALSGTAAAGPAKPWYSWSAELHRNHPLVGEIWSTKAERFISSADMAAALRQARYVLLGEIHDNPDHHTLQAWAIRTVGKDKRKPAVVMEMLNDGQLPAIQKFQKESEHCCQIVLARDLFKAVNWNKSGWPSAAIYQPIVEAVISVHARLLPGSVTRQQLRTVARRDKSKPLEGLVERLGLEQSFAEPLAKALRQELKDSHCGLLPDRALPAMMRVQRFRDAVMADRMVQSKRHAVLVAGNGHVRGDRGVPFWLRRFAPGKAILVITLAEVEPDKINPQAYVPQSPAKGSATDYVWFTPRTKRPDPCEDMRRHMKARPKKK